MTANWDATPAGRIARLDAALARVGEDAKLRRAFGTQAIPVDVTIRVQLRGYQPHELVGPITQQDQSFIASPSQINRAQWPGAAVPPAGPPVDQRIPRLNDRLITTRGVLTVQAAAGIYERDTLVRIEGRARGS